MAVIIKYGNPQSTIATINPTENVTLNTSGTFLKSDVVVTDNTTTYAGTYGTTLISIGVAKPTSLITTTYNGSVQSNGYTTPSNVTCTGNTSGTNAGDYVAIYTPNSGYCWSDGTRDAVSITLRINPRSISGATITLGDALTYKIISQTQTVSSVVINGFSATFTVSGNVQSAAGTYTLTCTGIGNFTGTQTASYTIARATITTFTLSGGTSKTYNGSAQSVSLSTISAGSVGSVTYSTSGTWSATNASTYTATVTGTGNYQGSLSATWTIAQKSIDTFTLNTTSMDFTNSAQSVSASAVSGGGLAATYSTSNTWSATEAGTYTATVTGTGNFTGSISRSWTINHIVAWAHYFSFSYSTSTKVGYPMWGSNIGGDSSSQNFQIQYAGNYRIQVTAGSGTKYIKINGTTVTSGGNANYLWTGWLSVGDVVYCSAEGGSGYQLDVTIILSSYPMAYYMSWTWDGDPRYSYPTGGRFITNQDNNTWLIQQSGTYAISMAGTYNTYYGKLSINGTDQGVSMYRDNSDVYVTKSLSAGDQVQMYTTTATEGFDIMVWRIS